MADSKDSRAKEIVRQGDKLFGDKREVDTLHHEIALQFYPKRATFTDNRADGEEYSDHLFSSYPPMARRELGNMLDEYLFPGKFFSLHVDSEDLDQGDQERKFLERLGEIMWRAMSDPSANLVPARALTNNDLATFGNGVLHYRLNLAGDGLLFRNFHLKDNAWIENAESKIDGNHRNMEPTAFQLHQMFKDKVSKEVTKALDKDPYHKFRCRHVVLPARVYDYKSPMGKRFPYVSLYVETETETVLEETGLNRFNYVIPRWQRVSGSVWGTSMVTDVLLPDGRTLQVVMRTLREAGERYADPPMIAIGEAIRGDIALYPGGVTQADMEYDEKLGEVLRPVTQNSSGFPIGMEIAAALKEDIRHGWMLDKIQLPEIGGQMTATEVRRRIQEHVRAASPISKPIQPEYNHPLCEGLFDLLMENGAFPVDEMPESLVSGNVNFKFRSPLDELDEQNEAELYLDIRDRMLMPALELDPSLAEIVDMAEATRDAMRSAGWKADWFKPKEAVEAKREQMAQEAEAQRMMEEIAQVGAVAEQGGKGAQAVSEAMAGPDRSKGRAA